MRLDDCNHKKILFYIGGLPAGGKERRFLELLSYLKKKGRFELKVVLRKNCIHYPVLKENNIDYEVIGEDSRFFKPLQTIRLFCICQDFKPDIIHAWGRMDLFYSIPLKLLKRITLVNSQITDAPPKDKRNIFYRIIDRINFSFSNIIVSNSIAGKKAYKSPVKKTMVVYNGVDLDRFQNLRAPELVKAYYKIKTPYTVVMVASFAQRKNYDLFVNVAESVIAERDDITFVAVGDGVNFERIMKRASNNSNIIFTGKIKKVEELVNASDIGVLFTNQLVHGEGISNAILEYMSLKKPVLANDAGGTKEIVKENLNGFLFKNNNPKLIKNRIIELIENPEKRIKMGRAGRKLIEEQFTISKMVKAFEYVYNGEYRI